jgi:hypothetical protein
MLFVRECCLSGNVVCQELLFVRDYFRDYCVSGTTVCHGPQILIQLLHCTLLLLAVVDELILCDAASAEARVHKILNGLSFTADMQQAPTKSLSGGWRMRLALAR